MNDNELKQYPFLQKLANEQFKTFFSPKKFSFWGTIGVGALALAGGVVALLVDHRKAKYKIHPIDLPLGREIKSLEVGGGIRLHLLLGSNASLSVKAPSSLLENVLCDMRGSRLRIYLMPSKHTTKELIDVELSLPSLSSLSVSGNAEILTTGINKTDHYTHRQHHAKVQGMNIEAARCTLSLTGSFESDMAIEKAVVRLSMIGDGSANIQGNMRSMELRMAGDCHATLCGKADAFLTYLARGADVKGELFTAGKGVFHLADYAVCTLNDVKHLQAKLLDSSRLIFLAPEKRKAGIYVDRNAELCYRPKGGKEVILRNKLNGTNLEA